MANSPQRPSMRHSRSVLPSSLTIPGYSIAQILIKMHEAKARSGDIGSGVSRSVPRTLASSDTVPVEDLHRQTSRVHLRATDLSRAEDHGYFDADERTDARRADALARPQQDQRTTREEAAHAWRQGGLMDGGNA